MPNDFNLQDILSSIVKTSEASTSINKNIFTEDVLTSVASNSLNQYNLIESIITKLANTRITHSDDIRDYAIAISTLRNVALTYLPKV